ncbi:MAG TPA: hypothetical protein VGU74_12710 [Gemmatimonadales bacterium]|nr:hypothetical protein [Gemmatimonadales bacterium]
MGRRPLWLIGCAVSLTLGGPPQQPHLGGDARLGVILQLLQANQGVQLGSPASAAESTSSLPYVQRFHASEAIVNSVERHPDGTIYASYTTPRGPVWYDVAHADDADDTRERVIPAGRGVRRFSTVRAANVDGARWLPPERAFPPGQGPAPRWVTIRMNTPTPHITTPTANSGDYCSRDVVSVLDPVLGIFNPNAGPPEWTTILPRNWSVAGREKNNGQRKYHPGLPLHWPGNHDVTWEEIVRLAQTNTARLRTVLKWHGRPSHGDVMDRPIPWISSQVTGVVTNSFLSGADYAGDHAEPPTGYWLGITPPPDSEPCGVFNAVHSLCDDWVVYVRPDPEYRFMLAEDHEREAGTDKGLGNFTAELAGSLETEIEQWLIPVGYRPEPGDRVSMTGRWVVDCGHDDWSGELHPIESVVAAHLQQSAVVASVVVTGDWPGGKLEVDVWPPARPSATATFQWRRNRRLIAERLSIDEQPQPANSPNHLHLVITSSEPWEPLVTGDWNEVEPHPTRRLAAKYRLWWGTR